MTPWQGKVTFSRPLHAQRYDSARADPGLLESHSGKRVLPARGHGGIDPAGGRIDQAATPFDLRVKQQTGLMPGQQWSESLAKEFGVCRMDANDRLEPFFNDDLEGTLHGRADEIDVQIDRNARDASGDLEGELGDTVGEVLLNTIECLRCRFDHCGNPLRGLLLRQCSELLGFGAGLRDTALNAFSQPVFVAWRKRLSLTTRYRGRITLLFECPELLRLPGRDAPDVF